MENLTQLSSEDFAARLASKEPVPGGGGAAALVGALSAALASMVGNYTTGKKKYAAVEADIQRLLAEAASLRETLINLVQADADAFAPLASAYAIAKDDPSRPDVLEAATKGACEAPAEMVRQLARVIDVLEEMGEKGSRMLLSDVGCGALFARAAMEAAALNVWVNTKTLRDRDFATALEAELDQILAESLPKAEHVSEQVKEKIRGKNYG